MIGTTRRKPDTGMRAGNRRDRIVLLRSDGPVARARIELGGPSAGTWAEVQTNPPRAVWRELMQPETEEQRRAAFVRLLLAHNLRDRAGESLPVPLRPEDIDRLELDDFARIAELWSAAAWQNAIRLEATVRPVPRRSGAKGLRHG